MKAIVVTDEAAGTAGMRLVERPEPPAAINDVIVQIHASGFVPTEMAWLSTWTDRRDRDRTPSIPGHELAGVVAALGYCGSSKRNSPNVTEPSKTGDCTFDSWLPRFSATRFSGRDASLRGCSSRPVG